MNKSSSLCTFRLLMVSRKSKSPHLSIEEDREGNGTVLTMWDCYFVTIIKSAPGIPGSIFTQIPGRPGLTIRWVGLLGPFFLSKPRPSRQLLDTRIQENDQGEKSLLACHLKNYRKDWLSRFRSRECSPSIICGHGF